MKSQHAAGRAYSSSDPRQFSRHSALSLETTCSQRRRRTGGLSSGGCSSEPLRRSDTLLWRWAGELPPQGKLSSSGSPSPVAVEDEMAALAE